MADRRRGNIRARLFPTADHMDGENTGDCQPDQYAVFPGILFFVDDYFCIDGGGVQSIYPH